MTLEKITEIAKWATFGGHLFALLCIFIGTISPSFSPIGRRSSHWTELGFELLKYTIPASIIYMILRMI